MCNKVGFGRIFYFRSCHFLMIFGDNFQYQSIFDHDLRFFGRPFLSRSRPHLDSFDELFFIVVAGPFFITFDCRPLKNFQKARDHDKTFCQDQDFSESSLSKINFFQQAKGKTKITFTKDQNQEKILVTPHSHLIKNQPQAPTPKLPLY